MKKRAMRVALVVASVAILVAAAEGLAADEAQTVKVFVLAGQSNMAGRANPKAEDEVPLPRVLTLTKEGTWVPAIDPIHFDKKNAGVGPGRTFGITLAEENPDITIGLIPCATGGSPIDAWRPGQTWHQTRSAPYDDAITRTQRALQDGVLKGILWHQGEADANLEAAKVYEKSLRTLIARFRKTFDAPALPFLIGQLGKFPQEPWGAGESFINNIHMSVAEKDPYAAFVSAKGLTCISRKNTHFDVESVRELGRRYAAAYTTLESRSE